MHEPSAQSRTLAIIESYPEWETAASRAKGLAVGYGEETALRRGGDGTWDVLVSRHIATMVLTSQGECADLIAEVEAILADAAPEWSQPLIDDESMCVRHELDADAENWNRSSEDGWFYADQG